MANQLWTDRCVCMALGVLEGEVVTDYNKNSVRSASSCPIYRTLILYSGCDCSIMDRCGNYVES